MSLKQCAGEVLFQVKAAWQGQDGFAVGANGLGKRAGVGGFRTQLQYFPMASGDAFDMTLTQSCPLTLPSPDAIAGLLLHSGSTAGESRRGAQPEGCCVRLLPGSTEHV